MTLNLYIHFIIQSGAKRTHVFEMGNSGESEGERPHGRNGRNVVPTRWSHSPHGKGFDDSCTTDVSVTRSLAFRPSTLAPTITRFICLRFLSLGGYLKSKVCVRKTRTFDELKVSIRAEIPSVPQVMLVNVMQNFGERLRPCVRQERRHFSDIIFRN